MADGVLRAPLVLAVEGEGLDDKLVDVVEGGRAVARLLGDHGDECDVGVVRRAWNEGLIATLFASSSNSTATHRQRKLKTSTF